MTDHMKSKSAHLSDEENARMARLYEEVSGRLEEMALITARVLHLDRDKLKVSFEREEQTKEVILDAHTNVVKLKGVRIICGPDGCGCWDYDAGLCYSC